MALRRCTKSNNVIAKLVTGEKAPCTFCHRQVDNEIIYGKLYAIGDIQCHYYCVLLSCCLIQKGRDEEGLFGFLYKDILIELERSKKHRCSYCGRDGATLGCCVTQCRKQFHLPCGRERNAVSLFYGNYKSYCENHAPKQKIPDTIMAKAKIRMKVARNNKSKNTKAVQDGTENDTEKLDAESVCVICYEKVDAFPTVQTFWPPCCARDAWFHRNCLQRMALSAGIHYLRCPLCNDKASFHDAIMSQGYYIPDRDASWELEQNAFAEIYERPLTCTVECKCELGRTHHSDSGPWEIKLCILCGGGGAHAGCDVGREGMEGIGRRVCAACAPAAPTDLDALAHNIETVILAEQSRVTEHVRRGPTMPSRMSLRRTKRNATNIASTSSCTSNMDSKASTPNITTSRQELNLKTPRKPQNQSGSVLQTIENTLLSPIKMLEQDWKERMSRMGIENVELKGEAETEIRRRFMKPKPFSEKRRIFNDFLDGFFENILKAPKQKEKTKEWCSPRKCEVIKEEPIEENPLVTTEKPDVDNNTSTPLEIAEISLKSSKECAPSMQMSESDDSSSTFNLPPEFIADNHSDDSLPIFNTPKKLTTVDIQKDSSLEISKNDHVINIDVVKMEETSQNEGFVKILNVKSPVKNKKCAFKFSPLDKEKLQNNNVDIDLESFKNRYLNEVDRDFKSNIHEKVIDSKETGEGIERKDNKRKLREKRKKNVGKKRKMADEKERNVVLSYVNRNTDNVDLSVVTEKEKRRKRNKKVKTKLSLRENNIRVKIKWRKEQVKLKITESKKKKIKKPAIDNKKKLKQFVLQYFDDQKARKELIVKPDSDVTPLKKKNIKLERTPDNLVQTSIYNFFTSKN